MKIIRKIIEIDDQLCDGCGQCIPGCAEGALQIVDGKARVVADKYCDGLGACIGECPTGALKIVERLTDAFDELAVEAHLKTMDESHPPALANTCPSTTIATFESQAGQKSNQPARIDGDPSALTHWPIQIRLVPPHAPFLKNADLLILADCAAVAYAQLQPELVRDRVVLMGCPKFDDTAFYRKRFVDIFSQNPINSITLAYMEVPCCGGLPRLVKKALSDANRSIAINEIMISTRGQKLL